MNVLTSREKIAARWQAFFDVPFPDDCVDLDPNGICLASTDSYAAGCITSYIDAPLPQDKIAILRRCHDDLQHALDFDLPDHVRNYFTELSDIAKLVLDETT